MEHLTVPHPTIRGKNIINDISFSLRKARYWVSAALWAPAAASHRAIFGQFNKGVKKEVYINGQKVEIHKPQDAIKAGIGFLTEERKLTGMVPILTIRENISLASLRKLSGKIFMNKKKEKEECQEIFDEAAHKGSIHGDPYVHSLRRQPAEGHPGQVAAERPSDTLR